MKILLAVSALLLLGVAIAPAQPQASASPAGLRQLADEYYNWRTFGWANSMMI